MRRLFRIAYRFVHNPLACCQALPYVLVAARRVARLEGRMGMQERVDELRRGKTLPKRIAHPKLLAGMVNTLLPLLPPFGTGRCYRRSLILLHLWSRCGLQPVLHLGIHTVGANQREGHAWLTEASLPDTCPTFSNASLRSLTRLVPNAEA